MLLRTDKNISDIAYTVGFADVPYFNRVFKGKYEMSPTKYREMKQVQ